jgi:Ni,Fe-hydrogenase III small subunit
MAADSNAAETPETPNEPTPTLDLPTTELEIVEAEVVAEPEIVEAKVVTEPEIIEAEVLAEPEVVEAEVVAESEIVEAKVVAEPEIVEAEVLTEVSTPFETTVEEPLVQSQAPTSASSQAEKSDNSEEDKKGKSAEVKEVKSEKTRETKNDKKNKKRSGVAFAIFPLSLGGSNAEKLEIEAMFVPPYNAASYGLSLTYSPFQADLILLYGSLTEKMGEVAYRLLKTLPPDIKLVALGSEMLSSAPFQKAYAIAGPLLEAPDSNPSDPATTSSEGEKPTSEENVAPDQKLQGKQRGLALPPGLHIAGYIVGSPPDPQALLDGILQIVAS